MQFSKQKLTLKLVLLLLLITSIPLFTLGYWSYWSANKVFDTKYLGSLRAIAEAKSQAVNGYLDLEVARIQDFSSDGKIYSFLKQYKAAEIDYQTLTQEMVDLLKIKTKKTQATLENGYYETLVLDYQGTVIGSTSITSVGKDESNNDFFTQIKDKPYYITDIYRHKEDAKPTFAVSAPFRDVITGELLGVIVNRLSTEPLNAITKILEGLGNSGESYIVNKEGYMLTTSRFVEDAILNQKVDTKAVRAYRANSEELAGEYKDYRGEFIVGTINGHTIAKGYDLDWLLLVEIDFKEAHDMITTLGSEILFFGLLITGIAVVIGFFSGRYLSKPIEIAVQEFFTTSKQLSVTVEEHERTASQQAAAVNETSATMDELGRSAQQSISQAQSANDNAQKTVQQALRGVTAMQKMLTIMEELSDRVDTIGSQILRLSEQTSQIGNVTEAVKDIANQTNLLALNAAVEATRAGEHGKGFTVVSQEIRKLAEQSKKSAEHISNLVDTIQKVTNATVLAAEAGTQTAKLSQEQVENAKYSFDIVSNSINGIAEVLQQIALTAQQQSNATNQVVEAMNVINTGANETANGISQSKIAIQNLNQVAEQLNKIV